MAIKKFLIIALVITILCSIFYLISILKAQKLDKIKVNIKNQNYKLEIVQTVPQRAKGLSDRKSLCSNCGMLFVFKKPDYHVFWMKNTLIPLDIIFLDENKNITAIHTAPIQPNTSAFQLKRYSCPTPSLYVIELNAGEAQKLNLKINDTINLPNEI
ncbi:DUF192 domain-containing protein [Patescibacteria group bacterium]|nr:DUF192 domain-containing protein [Patescibacteria group bacterium]